MLFGLDAVFIKAIVPLSLVAWYSVDTNTKLGYKAGYGFARGDI